MNTAIRNFGLAAALVITVGACSSDDGDGGGGGGNPTDTTPPIISNVASAGLATSSPTTGGATITWTTDEAADSQVEYGPDTTYGSSTTLNASMVTTHSVQVSGLTPSDVYHYRVKSKDAAGNLTTSADFTVTAPEQWLLLAEDGNAGSNNLKAFKASASSPVATPIAEIGSTNFGSIPLGEIHLANGKAFVVITSGIGLTGPSAHPSCNPSCGGLAVIDLANPGALETNVVLAGVTTNRSTRIVHAYIDPEGKFLWANNDGNTTDPDSVFRVNVDPSDNDDSDAGGAYLDYVEIQVGNGHKKSAFGRPSTIVPTTRKVFITSSLTERQIHVIDDDPTSGTYGQVIKVIRNVPSSPHGMDFSPNSGRSFSGITSGGLVSVDATMLDVATFPVVNCRPGGTPGDPGQSDTGGTAIVDDYCVGDTGTPGAGLEDPSVYVLSTGAGSNTALRAGYVHVYTHDDEDTVYTVGNNGGTMGWLTAVAPGIGPTPPGGPGGVEAIELGGDIRPSNFAISHSGNKAYVPSSGNGAITNQVIVVDVDHDNPTHNQVLGSPIIVGAASGENRNLQASPDGRLVMVPNTSTTLNPPTVSVIDTETDTVIDTLALTASTTAGNVRLFKLPFDAEDNH